MRQDSHGVQLPAKSVLSFGLPYKVPAIAGGAPEFDFPLFLQLFQTALDGSQREGQYLRDGIRPTSGGGDDLMQNPVYCASYYAIYCANFISAMQLQRMQNFSQHEINEWTGIRRFRTFVDCGIPLNIVQSIVGHMSPEMTKHYSAHASMEAKREKMQQLPDFLMLNAENMPVISPEINDRELLCKKIRTLPIEKVRQLLQELETI